MAGKMQKDNPLATKYIHKSFVSRLPLKYLLSVSLIVNIAAITLILTLNDKLPPQIPLFYGLAESEDQLANSSYLILPNLCALIIIIANSVIAVFLKDGLSKKALIIAGVTATALATITVFKIAS